MGHHVGGVLDFRDLFLQLLRQEARGPIAGEHLAIYGLVLVHQEQAVAVGVEFVNAQFVVDP